MVRNALSSYARRLFEETGSPFIAEAAFIDPNEFLGEGRVVLVTIPDEKVHRERYYHHRVVSKEAENQFRAARFINDYLLDEAKKLGCIIIDNSCSQEKSRRHLKALSLADS